MEYQKKYEEHLMRLSGMVGERNGHLLKLAMLGRLAGRTSEDTYGDIMRHCGEPCLSDAEVRRACEQAARRVMLGGRARHRFTGRTGFRPRQSGPTELQQAFVKTMIAAGGGRATLDALSALSPEPVGTTPHAQAAQFVRTVLPDYRYRTLAGSCTMPRTFENLVFPQDLYRRLVDGAPVPEFVLINQHTGRPFTKPDGKTSYAVEATLATRRLLLVEFDALDLAEQAAFWAGVIASRTLPVRTLVYSGGKSIHGLVRMREVAFHDAADDALPHPDARTWDEQWTMIERLICSDPDAAYRADRACKSACHFTRMPGHFRTGSGRWQRLLWCSGVQACDAPAGFAQDYGRAGRWYGDDREAAR